MATNSDKLGTVGAVLVVVLVVLWGAAALIAPAAIIKLCWLYLFG